MGTLSALMDLSKSALQSNQAALDITAKNVGNQNVTGYTREVATWSSDVVSINGTTIGPSSDTQVSAVSQRDRVLEQRVQQQTQISAASTAQAGALTQLENVFGLSSTSTSTLTTTLGSAIDGLYSSFSALANAPADKSARQAVLNAATALTSAFNSAANQVAGVGADLAQTAVSVVSQVNGLTKTIAALNKQIASISPNADAGTLEDQRQAAIVQLSGLVGLDQVTTENNGVTLSTSNGAVLVSGDENYALTASATGGSVQITAAGSTTNIAGAITGGQLGGVLAVQGSSVSSLAGRLDQLAYAVGTSVNQQNALGLDGNGALGGLLFNLPGTAVGAAGAISVATTHPSAIAAAGAGEGSAGNSNANALAGQATGSVISGGSAGAYFAGVLSGLGGATASATADSTAQQATLTQLTTQRDSLSAVSLDQEAASLTQYQRSYQAAAKLFSIVDTILEAAINLGSATTV